MKKIKKIAVLTSGGDAPGMNACIRAVVRTAIHEKLEIMGVYQGYQGLIDDNFFAMNSRSVSSIINLGGTILKSARSEEFKTKEGRKKAYDNIKKHNIDGLISIGGDGTFTGANVLSNEYDIPVVCIPGTIDNDLYGTDFTLGYDTANNTVIEAIDKIRDTAASHDRLFFIEVMGRDAGYIALNAGVAGGAEAILLPEKETPIEELTKLLEYAAEKNKTSTIVIVAEGEKNGGAYNVAKKVKEKFDFYDIKVSILGHLQRGGTPSSADRILATKLGYNAVQEIIKGSAQCTVGIRGSKVVTTPLSDAIHNTEFKLDADLMKIAKIMAM
ncbi:MAG TPA: 6-phosphofructokinase [Sphingobacterium sp.]|nr:6-phosphofructokinase [Sphingobacterium sp.]